MKDFSLTKTDCFAFRIGKKHPVCNALSDMMCERCNCGFYKTMTQYTKEQLKYPNNYAHSNIKKPEKDDK